MPVYFKQLLIRGIYIFLFLPVALSLARLGCSLSWKKPQILNHWGCLCPTRNLTKFDPVIFTDQRHMFSALPIPFSSHLKSILCHICLIPSPSPLCWYAAGLLGQLALEFLLPAMKQQVSGYTDVSSKSLQPLKA